MKELNPYRLMSRLAERCSAEPEPVKAMIELTYGCNLRCVHCYNPTHTAQGEISTEEIFRILDGLQRQGTLCVGFTGGELFTRRDAVQILRYAKQLGIVCNLLTNATMITPELADEIEALEPFEVDVSIYGATAETYEKVTRVPGSFAKFVKGADLLLERKIQVLLKLVMMTLNVEEWEAMRRFASSRGVRYKVGTRIHPKVNGSKEPLAYRLSHEQAFEIWRLTSGEKLRENINLRDRSIASEEEGCGTGGELFGCACGKSALAITPYGKMNLCLTIGEPQYDLLTGSVKEGWKELVEAVRLIKPGPQYECGSCGLAEHCERNTNDSWLETGAFDSECNLYYRELSERRLKFIEPHKWETQGVQNEKERPSKTVCLSKDHKGGAEKGASGFECLQHLCDSHSQHL